jgi:hypothetical protein
MNILIAAPVVPAPNTPIAAAPLLRKETRDIRRADGKGSADHAESQPKQKELPELVGIAGEPDWHSAADEQGKHHNPAAEPIRPNAERQAK